MVHAAAHCLLENLNPYLCGFAETAFLCFLTRRLDRRGLVTGPACRVDLHVVCPSGERIHGGNKKSACGGELDVDANVRAETRKPVENVFWEEGKAPAGTYQVYVHHYKKHQKRKSKDPTKFQVIVTPGGEPLEYNGELSSGDPIMMVAEFTLPSPEERDARKRELEAELQAASQSFEGIGYEEKVESEPLEEQPGDALPSAPDLDALMGDD